MRFLVGLRSGNDCEYIIVFNSIEVGTKVKWGHDDKTEDGLKEWTVIHCTLLD